MGQSIDELRKLTTFCRKNGILKYRDNEVEVQFSRQALLLPKQRKDRITEGPTKIPTDGPSKEDLLFWSSDIPQG